MIKASILRTGVSVLSVGVLGTTSLLIPTVVAAEETPHSQIETTVNLRNIGTYSTQQGNSGKHIRPGAVYRVDALNDLSPAGKAQLEELGVATVVDLRSDFEIEMMGADTLPENVTYKHFPIDDGGLTETMLTAISSGDTDTQEKLLGNGAGERLMVNSYRAFVSDATSRQQFAQTLRTIAESDGTVAVHCSAGKDRTGLAVALLHSIAGVSKGDILHNYLLSNEYRAEADAELKAGLKHSGYMENPDLLDPVLAVDQSYLDAAFTQIEEDYDSVKAFLRRGLGLDGHTISVLRKKLTTGPHGN